MATVTPLTSIAVAFLTVFDHANETLDNNNPSFGAPAKTVQWPRIQPIADLSHESGNFRLDKIKKDFQLDSPMTLDFTWTLDF